MVHLTMVIKMNMQTFNTRQLWYLKGILNLKITIENC